MTASLPVGAPSDRLINLRRVLSDQGVQGFIVPKADEHQGEYIALRSERLEWLTGFSGSAGLAVVLQDAAAVFVDGRYTLQVGDEVNGEHFEHCHLVDNPPADWIAEKLSDGDTIAYDAWLHTPNQVKRFQAACDKVGADLVSLDVNPIDTIWLDQPPPPISPTRPHAEMFSGRSSTDKREQISSTLGDGDVDALFLSSPDSIAWLLNIRGNDIPYTPFALSFAILHLDSSVDWFIDPAKPTHELAGFLGPDIRLFPPSALGEHLDQLAKTGKSIHLDFATDPMWVYQRIDMHGGTITQGSDPCQLAKAKKNTTEVNGIRNAHVRDGVAVCRFLAWLSDVAPQGGQSEMSIATHLEKIRSENEYFQGLSFPTISGSGPNGAIVHYRVSEHSNRQLDQNSLLLVDSGGQYLDGTTDITRTIPLGTPSDEMIDNFTRVLKGHIALGSARFPVGTSGSQLDALARLPLWKAGLDYDHGTGHGVGCYLSVHEGPQRISKIANSVALEPGMIVSNEPGYYKTGAYGIRIENLVAVKTATRGPAAEKEMLEFETLTLAPFDRGAINTSLLNAEEIAWVNDYHQRVFDILTPLLDKKTAAWLQQATRPLTRP